MKIDAQGVMQWNQTYGGPEFESATSFLPTPDGGLLLVGTTESYGAGGSDMWVVKLQFPADKDSKLTDIVVICLLIWFSGVLFALAVLGWLIRYKIPSQP